MLRDSVVKVDKILSLVLSISDVFVQSVNLSLKGSNLVIPVVDIGINSSNLGINASNGSLEGANVGVKSTDNRVGLVA